MLTFDFYGLEYVQKKILNTEIYPSLLPMIHYSVKLSPVLYAKKFKKIRLQTL
jgi:hypothetical protein